VIGRVIPPDRRRGHRLSAVEDSAPAIRAADQDTALSDGHHLARGAAANALVLVAANFRAVFTFLIARLLGDAALGRFGMAFAATELLSKIGTLGLDGAVIPLIARRAAAGDGDGVRDVFRRAARMAAVGSVATAILATPIAWWLATTDRISGLEGGGALMLLALPGIALARVATAASRSVLSMSNEFYSRGLTETWVTTAVFVVAVALGLRDSAPALAVVAGTSAAAVVALLLASRALRRGPPAAAASDGRPDGPVTTNALLRFSAPIGGASLLTVVVMQADVLLLGALVGRVAGVTAASFGVYCAAAQIAVGMRKVRQVFDPVFAPVIASRAAVDPQALRATVAAPGRWVLTAQLALVGVLTLSGGSVLSIYGASFRQGSTWLAILALAHGANSFAGLVETLLLVHRPGINLINAAITAVVLVGAGLILVPMIGIAGAAWATLIGFAVQGALRFIELRYVFGWSWPWASLWRPALIFVVALAPAIAVRMAGRELLSGAVFVAVYGLSWRTFGLAPEDREIWNRLMHARRALRPREIDNAVSDSGSLDSRRPLTTQ
jgi:O-antigen/teichoic acid export membrane protein